MPSEVDLRFANAAVKAGYISIETPDTWSVVRSLLRVFPAIFSSTNPMSAFRKKLLPAGVPCYHRPEFSLEDCRLALSAIRAARGHERMIKSSARRRIFTLDLMLSRGRQTVVVKQFVDASLWDSVKNWVRSRPARRSWRAANQALDRDIPTAAPCALIEDSSRNSAYLIMEYLEGWKRLDLYLREDLSDTGSSRGRHGRRNLLDAVAQAVRNFHDRGGDQPDFVAGNIVVRELSEGWKVAFIDLDAAVFRGRVAAGQRLRSLAKLDASLRPFLTASERLRSLRTYAGSDSMLLSRRAIHRILALSASRT